MLKTIAIVTLVVRSLAAVEPAYVQHLHYQPVERGRIHPELASEWAAPAMAGRRYVLLAPASGEPVYLRFIEAPAGTKPVRPFMTTGWNAAEILVQDPDALARELEQSPFKIIGPPADLLPGVNAPRAMQVVGPAGEVLYLTRIIPGSTAFDLRSARTSVDRVFIAVVGGASMDELRHFYGTRLGLPLGATSAWRIDVLAKAHRLPADSTFPLAVAILPKDYLVELDDYPPSARARPVARGALPPGMAMVTFTGDNLDQLSVAWREPPRAITAFPYGGRRAAVTVGPAGEWLEVMENVPPAVSTGVPLTEAPSTEVLSTKAPATGAPSAGPAAN